MNPTPSPSPLVVQIVADNQTPWWWTGALTGAFVLLAALVAFVSLRASDKRKLSREDQRQWDVLIKDGFVSAAAAIDELISIYNRHGPPYSDDGLTDEAGRASVIVSNLRATANEFELIANESTAMAMLEVVGAASTMEFDVMSGTHTQDGDKELINAEQVLVQEVKRNMRIAK